MKKEWIYGLPKIELHCHLDGSLLAQTVRELARMSGIEIPEDEEELRRTLQVTDECGSLVEYLQKFKLPLSCLQTSETLYYAAYSLIKDAAAENVIYIEVRFAPLSCLERGLTVKEAIKSAITGMQQGCEEFGVKGDILLCGMRHEAVDKNIAMLREAQEFLGKGVCGVDIAGSEADFPPIVQREFFYEAQKLGFPITIHAGECKNAGNVHDAILLGAKRVGHGIAIMDEEEILQEVKKYGIGLEMCPSSNLQTRAVESLDNYPLLKFFKEGLCVTLNTDNRMVTGTTLSEEYWKMAERFGLSCEDLRKITSNAIDCAFANEEVKRELHQRVEKYY